jgi:hypothetical protein
MRKPEAWGGRRGNPWHPPEVPTNYPSEVCRGRMDGDIGSCSAEPIYLLTSSIGEAWYNDLFCGRHLLGGLIDATGGYGSSVEVLRFASKSTRERREALALADRERELVAIS